jgi:hypothetical protein
MPINENSKGYTSGRIKMILDRKYEVQEGRNLKQKGQNC